MNRQDVTEKFPEIEELNFLIRELITSCKRLVNEIILDDLELQQLMHLSKRKTQQWRDEGLLAFSKPSGKIYYLLSDVLEILEKSRIPTTENSIGKLLEEKKSTRIR